MTFTVSRKLLLDELSLLQTVLETKTTMPVLAYVMFGLVGNQLTLTATNLDVSITTEIEATGDSWGGCLPSAQLYALVKLLDAKTAETVTFTPKDNGSVQVKAGKSKHQLPGIVSSEFPEIIQADNSDVIVPATTFNSMLSSISFAVLAPSDGIGASQYRFTGISMIVKDQRLSLTATNITRLATTSCTVETDADIDVIIPRQAIGALMKINQGDVSIGVTDSFLWFTNSTRRMYVRRVIDDKFPDWRSMFPATYEHATEINVDEIGGAIKRALLTQNEGRLVTMGLRWTFSNSELLIETRGGDRGKSDESVEIACPSLNGASVALGMNGQQVVDALGLLGEKVKCRFSDNTSIVELTPQQSAVNFVYYINTVSLKNWQ